MRVKMPTRYTVICQDGFTNKYEVILSSETLLGNLALHIELFVKNIASWLVHHEM